ncbi:hypothetical protein [Echinimonas agarilytica]|uniref:Uncharacterized protein n=1 Tax=Echinimonas agarilytica TaxID=1215918 RepID=A0AA42B6V3_9GAMM|nr:hypothetical protein [Echinimonas agarilytica]MCM2679179.1 hypothetical protein [Echinimonas agarilytica]
MKISNSRSFIFLKVVGAFFLSVIIGKVWVSDSLNTTGIVISTILGALMLSLILLSWVIELRPGKIISTLGIPGVKRTKIYNNIKCVRLGVDSQNVQGRGSNIVMTVTAEMSDGVGRIALKGNFPSKDEKNLDQYGVKLSEILGVPIEVEPRFKLVYEGRFGHAPRIN